MITIKQVYIKNSLPKKNNLRYLSLNQILSTNYSQQSDKYSKETIGQLKKQAQQFYEENVKESSNIFEISNMEQWKSEVLDSKDAIVLNCYAEWSQPCQKVTPLLVSRAKNSKSKWKLINLNIDHFGEIILQLQIKSVPTVMLINNSNTIDGFSGIPDEKQLKEFFETVEKICEIDYEKEQIQQKIHNAQMFIEGFRLNDSQNHKEIQSNNIQNLDEAKIILNNILQTDIGKNIFGAHLNMLLGYISAQQRNKNESKKYIETVQQHYSEEYKTEEIQKLLQKIHQVQEEQQNEWKGDWFIQECINKMEQDPSDLQVRFKLAEYQLQHNLYEDSIDGLLQIIKINRNWENRKAHTLLLKIFETLGTSNSIVASARKKLQKILY